MRTNNSIADITITYPDRRVFAFSPNTITVTLSNSFANSTPVKITMNGLSSSRNCINRSCKFDISFLLQSYFNNKDFGVVVSNSHSATIELNKTLTVDVNGNIIILDPFDIIWGALQLVESEMINITIYKSILNNNALPLSITQTIGNTNSSIGFGLVEVGDLAEGGIIGYILQVGDSGYEEGFQKGFVIASVYDNVLDWDSCVTYCSDLVDGIYIDYVFPTLVQLNKIKTNFSALNIDAMSEFWTSTEFDSTHAYSITSGGQSVNVKTELFYCMPIRLFSKEIIIVDQIGKNIDASELDELVIKQDDTIVKTYTIEDDNICSDENNVYLRWIDLYGEYRYMSFVKSVSETSSDNGYAYSYYNDSIYSVNNVIKSNIQLSNKKVKNTISCGISSADKNMVDHISTLVGSIKQWFLSGDNWIECRLENLSIQRVRNEGNKQIDLKIMLNDSYTQTI